MFASESLSGKLREVEGSHDRRACIGKVGCYEEKGADTVKIKEEERERQTDREAETETDRQTQTE